MAVEREVVAVEGAVAADERGDAVVNRTGERAGHVPIHAVVHDEKIHAGGHGLEKGDDARVDGGADFGDAAVVGELEAVEGAGCVLERAAAGAAIAEGDEIGELGHGGS